MCTCLKLQDIDITFLMSLSKELIDFLKWVLHFPFNRIQFLKINRLYNAITKKLTLQHIKN